MFLAACTEDVSFEEKDMIKDVGPMRIEVTDEFSTAATRADYSGFPATTFETNDAIGVYAFDGSSYVASNIRFVKQSDGSWTPDEDIPYDAGYTYYAYFPYRSTVYSLSTSGTVDAVETKFASFISDASNYFWQADQSTKAGFTYSNLMIAKGVNDVENSTVKFTMKHKRGLAVFYDEDATTVTFTGNIPYILGESGYFLMKPSGSAYFTDETGTYPLYAPAGEYVSHSVIIPWVDLGLPSGLLWAKRNIGAESVESKGKYFMWGNVNGYYPEDRYVWNNSNYASTIGSTLTEDIKPNATEDAARAIMGGVWRIPTRSEYDELVNGTDQEWLAINGIYGRKFMKKTDHSVFIFIPAGENGNGSTQPSGNTWCNYWSSSYDNSETAWAFRSSSSAVIKTSSVVGYEGRRYLGFNIRAVCNIYYPGRNGAFVYTTDDKFYTADEWTVALSAGTVSNDDVVGVAVISGEHRFVIAKSSLGRKAIYKSNTACAGAVSVASGDGVRGHYGGEDDTVLMVASYGSSSTYAAGAATAYTFANGKSGYLASGGEWYQAYRYKSMVDACMTACGGTAIETDYTLWSSTYQINSYYTFFRMEWNTGGLGTNTVTYERYVRPFCSLD